MSTITQFPSGNTQYRIEFDYLARTFIVVTLVNSSNPTLNRVLEVGRDYRFLNPTMIEMLVDQSGFDIVRIHRQTGTDLVVDFRNGSVLTASDLTNAELQAIHIAEEGRDQTVDLAKEYADAAGNSAGNAKDSEDEARRIAESVKAGLLGYITRRSFEKGFTVTTWSEVLLWEQDGEYYRWDGTLPKNVPAGSTPETSGGIGLGAWVSVGDASLRSVLSKKDGYSYIGELQSVADFFGFIKQNGARVKLRSWYAGWSATAYGKPNGGGEFIYISGVPKSKHDGCIYFSPTVPYSSTLSDYVTGAGESDPTGSGAWVRDIGSATHINTDWAGINDGATASSSSAHADAVQKVFNAAAALGKHVQLGYGFIHLEKAVSMPAFFDNTSAMPRIEGYGINSSYFICNTLGTDVYNLTCMLDNFTQTWGMKDFQIREKGLTKTGYLMKLGRLTGAVIERVKWAGGRQQLLAQSVLSCTWIEPCWFSGYRGAKFEAGGTVGSGYANPNANRLIRPQILTMENQGLWIVNATNFQIDGGSIEGCGSPGDTTFRGFYVQGGGSDGTVGLVVDGLYVETVSGYPFYITHSNNRSIKHVISNSNFNTNATQYPVSQVIVLGGNYAYPSGVTMTLEMRGNTILPVEYTGSASRPDVSITGYSSNDQAIFLDYDNRWTPLQPPVLDATVKWKDSPDFAFAVGVAGASGAMSNRRNITSVTRGSTGVYTITANHNITNVAVSLTTIGSPGYAILGGEPSGNTFVVRTYDTSGAAADRDFRVVGTDYIPKFNG